MRGLIAAIAVAGMVFAGSAKAQTYTDAHYVTSSNATSGVTVWTIGTEERFGVSSYLLSADTTMNVSFYSQTYLMNTVYFSASVPVPAVFTPGWKGLHQNDDLIIKSNTAGNVSILVTGQPLPY